MMGGAVASPLPIANLLAVALPENWVYGVELTFWLGAGPVLFLCSPLSLLNAGCVERSIVVNSQLL